MQVDITGIEQQYEHIVSLVSRLADYGPFAGILLAMAESLFPPLPLVAIVTVNIIAYGFVLGYLYSFVGTLVGSYLMFLIISTWGKRHFEHMVHRSSKFDRLLHWIKEKGFVPLFVLMTFPFTPSIVVCGLAGLAGVKNDEYFFALLFGKMIMVFSLSYIGYNITSFFTKPIRSVLMIVMIVCVSFIGKKVVAWYEKRIDIRHSKKS